MGSGGGLGRKFLKLTISENSEGKYATFSICIFVILTSKSSISHVFPPAALLVITRQTALNNTHLKVSTPVIPPPSLPALSGSQLNLCSPAPCSPQGLCCCVLPLRLAVIRPQSAPLQFRNTCHFLPCEPPAGPGVLCGGPRGRCGPPCWQMAVVRGRGGSDGAGASSLPTADQGRCPGLPCRLSLGGTQPGITPATLSPASRRPSALTRLHRSNTHCPLSAAFTSRLHPSAPHCAARVHRHAHMHRHAHKR